MRFRCALRARWGFALAFASIGCREPAPIAPPPSASAPAAITQPAATTGLPALEPGPEVALSEPGPDLIVEDQPWLRGIRQWAGTVVAVGDPRDRRSGLYRIGPLGRPEEARAVPLVLPGTKRVVDVAMQGETPVALVTTDDDLALAFFRGASWAIEPLPEGMCAAEDVILSAAPGVLVLLCPDRFHVLRAGSWKRFPIGPAPVSEDLAAHEPSRRALLVEDRLLVGFEAGEWGGALASLDIRTGTWKAYPQFDASVSDLAIEPNGGAWIAVGRSHLGGIRGSLSHIDASGPTAVAEVVGFERIHREAVAETRLRWDLPPASFEAVVVDDKRRLHLLTSQLGVVRRDGKDWTRLTPWWPGYVNVSGLAVRGDLLIIATHDGGVLLWDVATGKARRVELEQ